MAFTAPFIAPLRLERVMPFGSSREPSATPPAIPAAAAVPTSAGTFALPAAEPIELTPELTPEPIDSPTDPTESPTELTTPVAPLLLRPFLALLLLALFRLRPEGDREEPVRALDVPVGREVDARPLALRLAPTLGPLRADPPLLRAALGDLPLLPEFFLEAVARDAVPARAEDLWFLDGRAFV
jgi:hypothetical protein